MRIVLPAMSGPNPIASRTWLAPTLPDEHADPAAVRETRGAIDVGPGRDPDGTVDTAAGPRAAWHIAEIAHVGVVLPERLNARSVY